MMEIDNLKKLIELMRDSDVTELQIEKEGEKVKIKREKFLTSVEIPRPGAPTGTSEEDTQRLVTVTAPLVGTFYRAPSPDSPSFIEVGDRVNKGQVICIVEAMKLMNEIESEVEGVIAKALVDNAQPVEYGEPLFLIEPV